MEIVDKIEALSTDSADAPVDPEEAKMTKVTIRD